ncbi:MAG TPA: hypothetical protein VK623_13125 [Flavobacterium sp.]|nr:hypothetical protein [Flavobacterium sp.]
MSRTKKERSRKSIQDNRILKIIAGCFGGLCLGYFLLEYVSTWEDPPLGNAFHIVMGCALIAVAFIIIFVTLKRHYFPKKKRRGSKPVFLDDIQKKEQNR